MNKIVIFKKKENNISYIFFLFQFHQPPGVPVVDSSKT